MVELVAVIAVLLMIAGFLSPTLAKSRRHARAVASLAQCRQAGVAVYAYAARAAEIFPVAHRKAHVAGYEWYKPVIADGGFANEAAIDPDGVRLNGEVSYILSMAMVYSSEAMRPGQTVPIDLAFTSAVRVGDITWPTRKGLLVQMNLFDEGQVNKWCCVTGQRSVGAVTWADGSGVSLCWQDLVSDPTRFPYHENAIGTPVFSTWNGCKGVDR